MFDVDDDLPDLRPPPSFAADALPAGVSAKNAEEDAAASRTSGTSRADPAAGAAGDVPD